MIAGRAKPECVGPRRPPPVFVFGCRIPLHIAVRESEGIPLREPSAHQSKAIRLECRRSKAS